MTGTVNVHANGCANHWDWSYSARLADIGRGDQPFPIFDSDPGSGMELGGAGVTTRP